MSGVPVEAGEARGRLENLGRVSSPCPIEVRGLSKSFGRLQAVRNLSFEARPGSVTGFLGENGSGKTTTLRVLLGLSVPTSGSASFGGRRYVELQDPPKSVGAVLEGATFHPGRTGRNHLLALARAGRLDPGRADEVLDSVELRPAGDARVGSYSLGMRQRLGLAAALLGNPGVLVLDEPANGLDPEGIRWLRDLLRSLAAEGRTVLMSSHVLSEVAQTVDEVVVISRGRMVAQASLDALTRCAGVRVRSLQADRLAGLLEDRGLAPDRVEADLLTVPGASTELVGSVASENGIALHELSEDASTLEDVYLQLTASGEGDLES